MYLSLSKKEILIFSLYEKTAFMSFYVACQQNISLIFMVNKFYEIPESAVNIVEAGSKRQK